MQEISPIEKASRLVGGMSVLARMVFVSPPTVHEWKTSRRPVPPKRCILIELATLGQVSRRDLRPHDWQKIWPEMATDTEVIAQAATETIAS